MNDAYKTNLPLLTSASASAQGALLLESARNKLGFVPNMYGAMVNSPGLLETYQLGYERFRAGSGFTPAEQEVVFLAVSFENGCDYCMAAHSFLADKMSQVPAEATEALRAGRLPAEPKLAALADFTRHMVRTRGRPSADAARAFLAAGFGEHQILAIGVKTFSNYANHVFVTPVDEVFKGRVWTPPAAS